MLVLITYDVNTTTSEGKKRLNKVAKHCVNYGQRVQDSVFECMLDYGQYLLFKNKLLTLIDKKTDSIRIYQLGNKWESKVEHYGKTLEISQNDVLIL